MSSAVQQFEQLVSDKPLSHPWIASHALHDFDHPAPEHLRDIYHSVHRAADPAVDDAPKNLARLMPREHGKSETGSHVIPVWRALSDPTSRTLIMSETSDLAKGKLEECQETIERVAPQFGREIETSNATELTLVRDVTYDVPTIKAAGYNTGVTGGHYDLIIFDDIVSWESQRTEARRDKKWQMFQDYLNLGSEGETVYLVIGTRKHPDDLYSKLINSSAWDTRVEQAISDWSIVENNEYDVITNAGNRYNAAVIHEIGPDETIVSVDPRRDVETLWPERWPIDALLMDMLAAREDGGSSLVWKRENQNDAHALMGQVLSEEMLHTVPASNVPERGLTWHVGVDLGVEEDAEKAATGDSDYWAAAIVGYHAGREQAYLADITRKRGMTLHQGVQWLSNTITAVPAATILAEANQAQRWFVQSCREEGIDIQPTDSTGSKEDRIIDMSAWFENGKVKLIEREAKRETWESFATEWLEFPTGKHDDRLDAVEIALRKVHLGTSTGVVSGDMYE